MSHSHVRSYDLEFSLPKGKLLHHHQAHGIPLQGISCTLAKFTQLYLLLEAKLP